MKRIALLLLLGINSCTHAMMSSAHAQSGDTFTSLLQTLGRDGALKALEILSKPLSVDQQALLLAQLAANKAQAEAAQAETLKLTKIREAEEETKRAATREREESDRERFRASAAQSTAAAAKSQADAQLIKQQNIVKKTQEADAQRRYELQRQEQQAAEAARQREYELKRQQQQTEEAARTRAHDTKKHQEQLLATDRLQKEKIEAERVLQAQRIAEQDRLERERDEHLREANRIKNEGERQNQFAAAQHTDALARKREADKRADDRRAQEESIAREARAQEERVKREQKALADQLKQQEASNAIKLQQEIEAAKAKAKADAEKEKEVKEHELKMWQDPVKAATLKEKAVHEADLKKQETIAGINARIEAWNKAFKEFTGDPARMKAVGKFVIGTAAGVLFFRHAFPVLRQYVENRLFTPVLIQESSYSMLPDWLRMGKKKGFQTSENLYFDGALSARFNEIRTTLTNTKKNGGYYMNYLFYGPPGTGKTAVARALAYESGMDFAFMTGGSVLDLVKSGKAIQRFNEVFEWAQSSKKGLVLFIDECDAFLGDPSKMSEELNAIFKNFLNKTGTESKNFCLIFSTNHPDQLSKAIVSRVGYRQQLKFDTPSFETRKSIISYFMDKYLQNPLLTVDESTICAPGMISYIAQQTEGFSGRDLSYLILDVEKAAFASENPVITEALIKKIVDEAVVGFQQAHHFENHG